MSATLHVGVRPVLELYGLYVLTGIKHVKVAKEIKQGVGHG